MSAELEIPPITISTGEEPGDWQELSLTGYEKRVAEWAAENNAELELRGIELRPSKVKRIAYRMCKKQARAWDQDLWNVFGIPDPTPAQAIRNIERGES
ncbi:hypothetical protein SPF06_00835 [Sinomonas sp. JGH33]|uniref:Uncharacterized protein n=1 Tax=Sinomonas terricola TaxID=3110330 RepID=A0ABU5T0S3_9MICC|nr:hypothetical protein [Sinomonas sp. JGH33]MEA5453255.1 hypothetical protein [Sinomonas sp. JGH33]